MTKGKLERDPAKADILIVSHEATWTGAPILVHNIARELSARYNVWIMCVRAGGPLLRPLLEVATGLILLNNAPRPSDSTWRRVAGFLAEHNFKFAVVNSIDSRSVIPLLKLAKVPSVALMHEFATYVLPTTAFIEVMDNADYTVFSTSLTLETACETTGLSPTPNVRIIPQGKCEVPAIGDDPSAREKARAKLKAQLRPPGLPRKIFWFSALAPCNSARGWTSSSRSRVRCSNRLRGARRASPGSGQATTRTATARIHSFCLTN